jgi:AcrR family transcriptional regulator
MEDRRKTRSHKYLVDALVRLMKRQDIQSITIQNLVDEAQLARSTFYSLYKDKQHFLDKIVDDMFAQLRAEVKPDKFSKSSGFNEKARHKYYIKHFQYIAQNFDFFRVMLSDNGTSCFRKKMEDSAVKTYTEIFKNVDETKLYIPKDCLIQYVISAHMGLTIKWLQDGIKYSPYYMADMISRLTFEGIFHSLSLDNMVTPPK